MLNRGHDDDLRRVVDAVDDPVVASSRREKAGEFADKRLSEPMRAFADWAMQSGERCVADLRGQTVQVMESLRSDA
jgi:hypothetical protein